MSDPVTAAAGGVVSGGEGSGGAGPAGVQPPAPTVDEVSAPYWAALAERRVVVQRCGACGRQRFPRLPSCPYCATPGGEDVEITGTGTVYSWVRVERALTPAFDDQVPYTIATVELDGGGRVLGRLEPASSVVIGLPVAPTFFDHPGWTELRFRPA